jgi:hypothetical protein
MGMPHRVLAQKPKEEPLQKRGANNTLVLSGLELNGTVSGFGNIQFTLQVFRSVTNHLQFSSTPSAQTFFSLELIVRLEGAWVDKRSGLQIPLPSLSQTRLGPLIGTGNMTATAVRQGYLLRIAYNLLDLVFPCGSASQQKWMLV